MNSSSIDNPDELIPTRRSLLERLRDLDDQPSWREFFDTYWKLLYGAAIRAGLSDQEAEDVVQETVIGVAEDAGVQIRPGNLLFQGVADARDPVSDRRSVSASPAAKRAAGRASGGHDG